MSKLTHGKAIQIVVGCGKYDSRQVGEEIMEDDCGGKRNIWAADDSVVMDNILRRVNAGY